MFSLFPNRLYVHLIPSKKEKTSLNSHLEASARVGLWGTYGSPLNKALKPPLLYLSTSVTEHHPHFPQSNLINLKNSSIQLDPGEQNPTGTCQKAAALSLSGKLQLLHPLTRLRKPMDSVIAQNFKQYHSRQTLLCVVFICCFQDLFNGIFIEGSNCVKRIVYPNC